MSIYRTPSRNNEKVEQDARSTRGVGRTGGDVNDCSFGGERDKHEQDWRNVLLKVGDVYSNWDDFMYFAALQSLLRPDHIVDKGSNKLCYRTPIILMNSEMVPVYEFSPSIIISANNRHVITAYPGDRC